MAIPSLERLLEGRHAVVTVVSQPDRGRGRGRKQSPSPVSELALAAGVPLLRPQRVGDPEVAEALREHEPDLGVVVAYGQFIAKRVRTLPAFGYMINAHASLLPKYRGASPVAQAILNGENRTGVSIMRLEREMDAGPVALVREIEIEEQENTAELTERLSRLAADAIAEVLDQISCDTVGWSEQDHARASVAPKLEKRDGLLDWRQSSRTLVHRIHALAPRPGAFTHLPAAAGERPEVLRILRARADCSGARAAAEPGTARVASTSGEPALQIATGDDWLLPLEVQRPGGRILQAADFLRGRPLADGVRLGVQQTGADE